MRYDWKAHIGWPEFSQQFFDEIDRRFLTDARAYLPWRWLPFEQFVDYAELPRMDVLEIGVGMGTHAHLLASHAKSYTGIDITDYAVKSVSTRLEVFGLPGRVVQMDAEQMGFDAGTFDLVWSWGVIHHSANTTAILREIHRVLRPGGWAVIMVYHRSLWNYYVVRGLLGGLVSGELLRTRSIHRSVQAVTDGALARFYSMEEWRRLAATLFDVTEVCVLGSKMELIPLPGGQLKTGISRVIPDELSRFITNRCRVGSFLVSTLQRRN